MYGNLKKVIDVFSSERLIYVPLNEELNDFVIQWRSAPEIVKYYRNQNPITREEHLNWYYTQYLNDPLRYDWIVFAEKEAVGFVALSNINNTQKSCEISYTIGNKSYRNRHLSEEMIFAIMNQGKKLFCLQTFYAEIHKDNIVSQKAAERCGFHFVQEIDCFRQYIRRYSYG